MPYIRINTENIDGTWNTRLNTQIDYEIEYTLPGNQYDFPKTHDWIFFSWYEESNKLSRHRRQLM